MAIVTFVLVALLVSLLAGMAGRAERERDAQRAVLLRSVSHDLRNPLATIRAASAELRDGLVDDEATRSELLDLVVAESDRLDRIVGNLLSLSRVEAGKLSPDREPEELDEIVAGSVRRLAAGRRIDVRLPDDLPDVDVDRTQIDQVLTNLLENALRHGGGTPVLVGATPAGSMVEVSVADGGPGFADRARQRATEFFTHGRPDRAGRRSASPCARRSSRPTAVRSAVGDRPGGGALVSFTIPQA